MKHKIIRALIVVLFSTVLCFSAKEDNTTILMSKDIVDTELESVIEETECVEDTEIIEECTTEEVNTEVQVTEQGEMVTENTDEKNVVEVPEEETIETSNTVVEQKYSYCPIGIDLGGSVRTFYCENKDSGVISDHIYTSYNGSKSLVLSPGSGWDSIHVCDPSVIEGNFSYCGTPYRYLMAYLGCNTTDCQNNQIGLAVSNSLESGWVKVYDHPFISYSYDNSHSSSFQWGVGQPSLVSVDNSGTIAIFYTRGTWNLTSEIVEVYDLSNLDSPVNLGKATVSNSGTGDFISNADFCYNTNTSTLYMVSDVHPFSNGILSNIPSSSRVCSTIVNLSDVESIANCNWSTIKYIDRSVTGHARNHNAGFIRDSFGHTNCLPSVLCSTADILTDDISSLWSYTFQRVDM